MKTDLCLFVCACACCVLYVRARLAQVAMDYLLK